MNLSQIAQPMDRAVPAQPRPGRLIAVGSGKGGVGKTWLSITLAHALAQALAGRPGELAGDGPAVLLVDADLGLANVDVQLGLDPTADLGAVLGGRRSLAEAALRHPAGFDILPGRSGSGALAALDGAALEGLLAMLAAAAAERPAVVLDLGAGLGRAVRRLAAAADRLLVVATDEPTSLTDAYAVLKLHRQDLAAASPPPASLPPAGIAEVVVNQAADRAAGERSWRTLDRACRSFLGAGVPLAGVIRRDPRVPDAIRRQTPLLTRHPSSLAATDVTALARHLLAS